MLVWHFLSHRFETLNLGQGLTNFVGIKTWLGSEKLDSQLLVVGLQWQPFLKNSWPKKVGRLNLIPLVYFILHPIFPYKSLSLKKIKYINVRSPSINSIIVICCLSWFQQENLNPTLRILQRTISPFLVGLFHISIKRQRKTLSASVMVEKPYSVY